MHSYRDRKEFDHLTRQLAARYLDDAATATDASELPDAPEAVLESALELAETRLRRQVVKLRSDGLLQ